MAVGAAAWAGVIAILLAAMQFTQIPWKAYSFLSRDGWEAGDDWTPTHILVMGGSGIPGESGLMRLWYAADAAAKYPGAPVWMALPCCDGDSGNPAAAAYAGELNLRGVEEARCEPRACGENTRAQAVSLVRDLGKGDESARVLLVTSPEHVLRACLAVRRAARDAGRGIEVRGVAAENLSLDDHEGTATPVATAEDPPEGEQKTTGPQESAGVFRYDFWNHAEYTLRSAREFVALLYYRIRGWI